jgi:purine-binding chemotaxis protein CheW
MTIEAREVIRKVAQESTSNEKADGESHQFVVFDLDKEEYAVPISDAKEIIKIPRITPVPGAPEFISGIFNLRGKIIVVVDLEKRFRLVREHPMVPLHSIIVEVSGTLFGVVIDQVMEVVRVPTKAIKPAPALVSSKIHAEYVSGIAVLPGEGDSSRLLIMLDLPKLLQDKELLGFGATVQKAVPPDKSVSSASAV